MSRKSKVQMPYGSAGLIRYFDSEKEAIKLKPEHVIIACGIIIAIEIFMRFGIFG